MGPLFNDTGPFFDRGEVRSADLRRGREVFEGEEPFDPKVGDGQLLNDIEDEVHDMTGGHPFDSAQGPDHSRKSYGRNIGVWRSKSTKRAGILLRRCSRKEVA